MKAKKLLPIFLSAAAFTAGLSGCSDYDNDYTATDILYAQNFEQVFGKVDPNQDWNLLAQLANAPEKATRSGYNGGSFSIGSVTVETLPESQACPLDKDKMEAYRKMLPEIGSTKDYKSQTNLGRVTQDFTARVKELVLYPIYWWTDASDEIGIYYRATSDTPGAVVVSHTTTQGVTTNVTDAAGNDIYVVRIPITVGKPTELEYSKNGKRVIGYMNGLYDMPIDIWTAICQSNTQYKTADGTNAFVNESGWKFEDAKKLIFAGTNAGGDYYREVNFSDNDDWNALVAASDGKLLTTTGTEIDSWDRGVSAGLKTYLISEGGEQWKSVVSWLTSVNVDPIIENAESPTTEITGFRSKGIKVTLPETAEIGFYIDNGCAGTQVMYSDSKLNYKKTFTDTGEENACHIATYKSDEKDKNGKDVRYLGFEDWKWNGDYDLNDIIFRVYGLDDETIIDNEVIREEGLFVCEDLGNFDFDFNDVVLKALWRRYYKRTYIKDGDGNVIDVNVAIDPCDDLTITGMAAGGSNPSEVYFKTASATDGKLLGEIHKILKGSAPSIINAGYKYNGDGKSFEFKENFDFPEPWDEEHYPTGYVSQMFGKGLLFVKASTTNSVPDQDENEDYNVEADHIISGDKYRTVGAPQMMLLPMYYEWCQESKPIETVYPHFTDWVSDATKLDWITNEKKENLTTDRGVTPEMYSSKPVVTNSDPDTPPVTPPVTPDPEPTGYLTAEQLVDTTIQPSVFASVTSTSTITIKINVAEGGTIYFHYPDGYNSPTGENIDAQGNMFAQAGDNTVVLTGFDVDALKTKGLDLQYMASGSKVWVTIE